MVERRINSGVNSSQNKKKPTRSNSAGCADLSGLSSGQMAILADPCGICGQTNSMNASGGNSCSFVCSICDIGFHGSCLNFDQSSLELISAVIEDIPWSCNSCLQTTRNSRLKGKTPLKSAGSAVAVETEVGQLRDRVAVLEETVNRLASILLPADTLSWPTLSQAASIVDNVSKKVTANSGKTKSVGGFSNGNLPLNDVLSAVHTEMIDMSKRRTNLIIYGLPLSSQQSDGERFKDLCTNHWGITPPMFKVTKRLGEVKPGRVQHLLVALHSESDVIAVTKVAARLRSSSDDVIRSKVFINRDMTKTEAKAAYDLRLKKRLQRLQKSQKSSSSHSADSMEIEPSQDGSTGSMSKPSTSEIKVVISSSVHSAAATLPNPPGQSNSDQSSSDQSSDAPGVHGMGDQVRSPTKSAIIDNSDLGSATTN